MSNHQFNVGELVQLPPLEIVQEYEDYNGVIWLEIGEVAQRERNIEVTHDIITERPENGQILVRADFVLPTPREGEYRLTVEEIVAMASFAEEYAVENATGRTYWSVYKQAVEQWLANRKEAK